MSDVERGAIDRRDFVRHLALAAGATALGARALFADARADTLPSVGIDLALFARDLKKDYARTLTRLARIGFQDVQFPTLFGTAPAEVREMLKRAPLAAPSLYIEGGLLTILRDWPRTLDRAKALGATHLTLPGLDARFRNAPDNWPRLADAMNRAGAQAKAAGVRIAYRNQESDFVAQRGRLPYDVLLERTDRALVFFELDVYAMVRGGRKPVEYIQRWPGRFPLLAAIDMRDPLVEQETSPQRPIGTGILDYQSIFARRKQAGLEHVFVAIDQIPPNMDAWQFALLTHRYLAGLSF